MTTPPREHFQPKKTVPFNFFKDCELEKKKVFQANKGGKRRQSNILALRGSILKFSILKSSTLTESVFFLPFLAASV